MLARAYQHKESLTRLILKSSDNPYYDYIWENSINFDMDIKNDNWYKHQWVSLDSGYNVIGYFEAGIARCAHFVDSLLIINFFIDNKITFSHDLKEFFFRLFFRYNYNKIVFSVIVDSPSEKLYDKFINRYNGRIVGIFKKHRILQNGSIRDLKYYEIMKEDFERKTKELYPNLLKEKLKNSNFVK